MKTNSQFPIITDEFGGENPMLGDNVFSGAPLFVDVDHHEIHCGDSYMATRVVDLGNGASDTIILNVPNETIKRYHLIVSITSEAECDFGIYEGATTVSDGTALTQYNRDRNSTNTTGITTFHSPNTPAAGTLIENRHWGSGKSSGGETRGAQEIILKNNTKYRFIVTNSTTNANHISWEINHYVHPGI